MAKRRTPAPTSKTAPERGGPPTLYPGKRHALSIKVTDEVKALIEQLQAQRACSVSDVVVGRMRGDF